MKKLIFRYTRTNKYGNVYRARRGHPFPMWVEEDPVAAESSDKS